MNERDELLKRLQDLQQGPWVERAHLAKQYLAPKTDFDSLAFGSAPLDLRTISKLPEDTSRESNLMNLLRWHGDKKISLKEEIDLRDSLDFALSYLQLLELAVETGYLTKEVVYPTARKEVLTLLWSQGAQRFVKYYDYVAVEYLANRVEVHGFRAFTPPEPDSKAAVRFASFLSQHIEWLRDKPLEEWLSFLDDYVRYSGEQTDFYKYLDSGNPTASERFQILTIGIHQFLEYLANLFGILEPAERARFGLFYSYWIAKFFGYKLQKDGYIKDPHLRGNRDSWADAVLKSPILIPPDLAPEDRLLYSQALKKKIEIIGQGWQSTRELIADSSRETGGI